jgi:ergothioneine biosynthesis protein EgtB
MPMTTRVAESLATDLVASWARSDSLFDLVAPEAILARPIPLRQPFLFYVGHLPAFTWHHLAERRLGAASFDEGLDALFARGIDPPDLEDYRPEDPSVWPSVERTLAYRDRVRAALRDAFDRGAALDEDGQRVLTMVLEHERMHHETLLYMVHQLPRAAVRRPAGVSYRFEGGAEPGRVHVDAGRVQLGARRSAGAFGWDNEFDAHEVAVPGFTIDTLPVRNRDFLRFVEAGGYQERGMWSEEAWAWLKKRRHRHPLFWSHEGGAWRLRTLFDEVALADAFDWPVSVTWAEANAYAAWRGGRLPTEAELHRAAYTARDGRRCSHPWGDDVPADRHGNFGFRHWSPTPAGSYAGGRSAWGVHELVGNGWEWTSTAFAPFPGFEPMPGYPGYSRDFFDDRHYVLVGASWATDDGLVRRSFRNWFQPHYPYLFSKFRCVFTS